MDAKAVDVAILPSEAIMDKVVEINAELVKKFGKKIVLNKNNTFPHISLAMGCIEQSNIPAVEKILNSIAKDNQLPDLTITHIAVSTNSIGEEISAFAIEKSPPIQQLHENIMTQLADHLSCDATAEMINFAGQVAQSTLLWIKNYRQNSSFANFSPHITLGYGRTDNTPLDLPLEFTPPRLALCHLGNHCTCTEILFSIKL